MYQYHADTDHIVVPSCSGSSLAQSSVKVHATRRKRIWLFRTSRNLGSTFFEIVIQGGVHGQHEPGSAVQAGRELDPRAGAGGAALPGVAAGAAADLPAADARQGDAPLRQDQARAGTVGRSAVQVGSGETFFEFFMNFCHSANLNSLQPVILHLIF